MGGFYFSKGADKDGVLYEFQADELPYALINNAKREKFDEWIFNKANASEFCDAKTGTTIKTVLKEGKGHVLKWEGGDEYFDFIIACDGERSTVKKALFSDGIKKHREHHLAAVRAYYKGVKPVAPSNPLEVYFMPHFGGLLWIFHLPNGECNVGLGGVSTEIADKKVKLRNELEKFVEETPDLKDRFKNAVQTSKPKGWGYSN